MKTSLRQRLEDMLERILGRIKMLDKSIKEYKLENDFENAMKCDIKRSTLQMVADDLRKQLLE